MKKFTIPCHFGKKKAPFDVYIGNPKQGHHPLEFQSRWLKEQRGGKIPEEVMESYAKLLALAKKNRVSFEDLCVYALEAASEEKNKSNVELQTQTDLLEKADITVDRLLTLAKPEDLSPYFDENFYLLQFPLKSGLANAFHVVFLIKEKNLENFKLGYPYASTDEDKLSAIGKVECTVKEMNKTEIYSWVSKKYGIEVEKIEANAKIELK
ncbi:hypothetical protein GCM10027284_38330 [Cyclobacterium sediminis]